MIRAVLDTNVIISALLFSGPPSQLVSAWQSSRLRPVVSAPVLDEYIRVLAYPKFKLSDAEIRSLVEKELLPFIETVKVPPLIAPKVRDLDDAKFITCAITADVRWLVSGDDDLLSLHRVDRSRSSPSLHSYNTSSANPRHLIADSKREELMAMAYS